MKKEEKKQEMNLLIIAGVLLIAVIGVTYAWLTQTIDKTKTNVIKAGTLELTYKNESEGIYLSGEKAQPVSDEEGKKYTPYKFTLKNTGDFKADYTIYLDDTTTYKDGEEEITIEKDKFMKNAFVKYRLLSSNTYTTDTKPEGTSNIETLQLLSNLEESPKRVLEEGTLAAGESKDYELTLWISSEADNSVVGTTFAGKIRVEATQNKGKTTNTWTPKYFAFGVPTTESTTDYKTLGKNVFAALDENTKTDGICIQDGGLFCIKSKDYDNSKVGLKSYFGEDKCNDSTDEFTCASDTFRCNISSNGYIYCHDSVNNEGCSVHGDGYYLCS